MYNISVSVLRLQELNAWITIFMSNVSHFQRGRSEEMQLWQENEQKLLSPAYHERIQISTAKRDQLLQEKTWLQVTRL